MKVLSIALILLVFLGCNQAPKADLIVFNANVYTVDPTLPKASSFAVKDGKILAVGSDTEIQNYKADLTEQVDAGGSFLFSTISTHLTERQV